MSDGIIHNPELFLQTQILDYSGLKLPRNIKPSDSDMILDNAGEMLWCELKTYKCGFNDLSAGQGTLLRNFCRLNPQRAKVAILWTKKPEKFTGSNLGIKCCKLPDDIIAFQTIRLEESEFEENWIINGWYAGYLWQRYLDRFYRVS